MFSENKDELYSDGLKMKVQISLPIVVFIDFCRKKFEKTFYSDYIDEPIKSCAKLSSFSLELVLYG